MELPVLVGPGDEIWRPTGRLVEKAVARPVVETDKHLLHRFTGLSVQHLPRKGKRIKHLSRRKRILVILEHIAFVEVLDGVAQVDGIGGVGLQAFLETDDQGLVAELDVGFVLQRRRHQHVLVGVVEGDILVEGDFYFLTIKINATILWLRINHFRGCDVLGSTCGCYHIGASCPEKHGKKQEDVFYFVFHRCKSNVFVELLGGLFVYLLLLQFNSNC